jgi:hypothetical protein
MIVFVRLAGRSSGAHTGVLQSVAQFCVAKHVFQRCGGDSRIFPSLHSTDMLGFRQKSRHSGKRADIPANESTFRQKPVPVAGPSLFGGAINGDGEIGET